MADTYNLSLPLLAAAQAQKHVTVNEALAILDSVAQMRVVSAALTAPPGAPADGEAYIVPTGASGAWEGQQTAVAVHANGGWIFLPARAGWEAWDESTGRRLFFDGTAWRAAQAVSAPGGALTLGQVLEVDHALANAASSTISAAIPDKFVVLGVTARVIVAITGTGGSWSLGVPADAGRYGAGLGVAQNAFAQGVTGQPQAYYGGTDLVLTAGSGAFTGGVVRLAIHGWSIEPPGAV